MEKCLWLFSFTVFSFSTERAKTRARSTFVIGKEANVKICSQTHNHGSTYLSSHITSLKFRKVCVGPVEFS